MNDSQRARFERQILTERVRLEEVLARASSQMREPAGERGRFADDAALSSAGASVDDDRALLSHTTRELAELDEALRQLRDDPDHFGSCTTCGTSIPFERLRLVPGTRYCVAHAPM
jgi:RNA polymerase-binding transcription factor DksA